MSLEDAADFGWAAAGPIVGFVLVIAVFLIGFALLSEIRR